MYKKIQIKKRSTLGVPNPDDARPIVRRPTDLPVTTEPGHEPRDSDGTAGAVALRSGAALYHCATREAPRSRFS